MIQVQLVALTAQRLDGARQLQSRQLATQTVHVHRKRVVINESRIVPQLFEERFTAHNPTARADERVQEETLVAAQCRPEPIRLQLEPSAVPVEWAHADALGFDARTSGVLAIGPAQLALHLGSEHVEVK